jgi:SAM-dependent methyltransferase
VTGAPDARSIAWGPVVEPVQAADARHRADSELPDDFHALDFDALWRGRGRTTAVEGALVRHALGRLPTARVVELGTGDGRLSPFVLAAANEYVGVDQRFEFLQRLARRLPPPPAALLVEANIYHLPFVDAAVTASLLARVYNFLPDPVGALTEIGRTLAAGGGLVLTCSVRPSVLTLADDLRTGLSRPPGRAMRSMTFTRADVVPVVPGTFPATAPTRHYLNATLRRAGFAVGESYGSGLEDSRWSRAVPGRAFRRLGIELGSAPIFPLLWRVARWRSGATAGRLPPLAESLACPRCRRPFGPFPLNDGAERTCGECGFRVWIESGILRARYVPN